MRRIICGFFLWRPKMIAFNGWHSYFLSQNICHKFGCIWNSTNGIRLFRTIAHYIIEMNKHFACCQMNFFGLRINYILGTKYVGFLFKFMIQSIHWTNIHSRAFNNDLVFTWYTNKRDITDIRHGQNTVFILISNSFKKYTF